MGMYYNSVHELIGNTPLLKLNHLGIKKDVEIFAKLELWNPGGSVKDRIGTYMIKDAEDKGLLNLVEPLLKLPATQGLELLLPH